MLCRFPCRSRYSFTYIKINKRVRNALIGVLRKTPSARFHERGRGIGGLKRLFAMQCVHGQHRASLLGRYVWRLYYVRDADGTYSIGCTTIHPIQI